jgi:hypothetical protein
MLARCSLEDRRRMAATLAHEVHDHHAVELPALAITVVVTAAGRKKL